MRWTPYARAVSHKINMVLGTHCRGVAPVTFVIGFPKSGTTWACQLVADCIEKPFTRYNLFPTACPAVIHGHEVLSAKMPETLYLMRDGRDAMISLYNQYIKQIPADGALPRRFRKCLPNYGGPSNHAVNLPGFLAQQAARPDSARVNWSRHVMLSIAAAGANQPVVKYEDLLSDRADEVLAQAIATLTGKEPDLARSRESLRRYAFTNQAHKPNIDNRYFMNKGLAGNWRSYFTRESAQVFADKLGEGLIAAGYEPDHAWVDTVPEKLTG